ncbi:MAG: Aminomethyltransferase folate-binding domain [Solirubrobacteraceae bacterium]|jgi:glycine cleavage system aminomethyltransferase T|nr:Aminomethyltransferase folate-binding domain [Solirubrobacteraceae bacterium]
MQTDILTGDRPAARFARRTAPGAMVVARDGRAVTAHYGSVATEIAVCRKAVGLAFRTELRVLELAGREPWLERLLSRAHGGIDPRPGTAAVAAGTWCCRLDQHHALVVGASGAVERWRRVAREAVIGGSPITATELTDAWSPMSLIGPKAGRLLDVAGLPTDLPVHGLRTTTLAGVETLVLRTAADHWLLLVDSAGDSEACHALFEGGRPVGLSLVGSEAVGRLAAAARPHALAL